jgi:hypothetical protein
MWACLCFFLPAISAGVADAIAMGGVGCVRQRHSVSEGNEMIGRCVGLSVQEQVASKKTVRQLDWPWPGEICYFDTLNFGCLLLCHPVSMTGGTVCVYNLWVRLYTSEAHK